MRAAIAQVVNALLHARLESIWGAATSTCASDSKKYHAVDQNLLAEVQEILAPIRNLLPNMMMIDFSPFIAMLLLQMLGKLIVGAIR